jgi:anti-sigma B factor antagonist
VAMDEALTIRVQQEPRRTLVTVSGDIDISTADQLRERLTALVASGRPLVIDLNPVTFIGATGLGVLAVAASRATAHGGTLHVASDRYQTRQLFRITGLHNSIPLSRTIDEALAALPPQRAGTCNNSHPTCERGYLDASSPRPVAEAISPGATR